jgi:hypothetical protein
MSANRKQSQVPKSDQQETKRGKGRPPIDVRWTLSLAAREFGLGEDTLRRKVAQALLLPGDDGRWSTRQICAAVFDDLDAEKVRLTRAQADKAELDLEERRKQLVSCDGVAKFCTGVATAIRQKLIVSSLPVDELDALLRELETMLLDGKVTESVFATEPNAQAGMLTIEE